MSYTVLTGAKVLISTDGKHSLAIDTGKEIIPVEQPPRVINPSDYGIDFPALAQTALEMAFMNRGIGVASIDAELPEERAQMDKLEEYINSSTAPIQLLLDSGTGFFIQSPATCATFPDGWVTQLVADMTLIYDYIPITCNVIIDVGARFTALQVTIPALALTE